MPVRAERLSGLPVAPAPSARSPGRTVMGRRWSVLSLGCSGLGFLGPAPKTELVGADGWNTAPTPFVWDGKRRERRLRARQRQLGGSPAVLAQSQAIAA
jgi:hypothetical protein